MRGDGSAAKRHVATRAARGIAALALLAAVGALATMSASCGADDHATTDGGALEAAMQAPDPCDLDAFTGAGMPCGTASPLVCFPECEAGGCSCVETTAGPRWSCVTDLSCLPACAPIDDGCTPALEAGAAEGGDERGDAGGSDGSG